VRRANESQSRLIPINTASHDQPQKLSSSCPLRGPVLPRGQRNDGPRESAKEEDEEDDDEQVAVFQLYVTHVWLLLIKSCCCNCGA